MKVKLSTLLLSCLIVSCFSKTGKTNPQQRKRHDSESSNFGCDGKVCPKEITRALDTLLSNYDNRIRPGFDSGKPTKVYSQYFVTGFGPASEQDMEYSLDMFFRQRWRDERLAIISKNKHIDELTLNSQMVKSVWTPDSFFRNGKKSIAHNITVPNRLLRINREGYVLYTMRLTVKAKCPMTLIDFPMDVHTCSLEYGSFGYTSDEVKYIWYETNTSAPVDVPPKSSRLNQFILINYTWSSAIISTVSGDFSILKTQFHLKRQMGYYVIQTYLPCILIVILSQISFWINKEAVPARTVSGIMTVLNVTTLSISTRQSLPKVAYATALDWYMAVCFAFCFAALIEFASVNYSQIKLQKSKTQRKKKNSDSDLDPCLFQSCAALRERIIVVRRIDGDVRFSLSDLYRLASGISGPSPSGYKYCFSKLFAAFPSNWFKRKNASQKDDIIEGERDLAGRLIEAVEPEIEEVAMSQGGVSRIDQVSRIGFPATFMFFNAIYWYVYLTHQSHEVNYRLHA